MTSISAFNTEEILKRLKEHPDWELKDNKLYRRLVFEDFVHAFGFLTQVAIISEKMNHHPEWANVYRTVDIYLTTHEVSGISTRDFALLESIERLLNTSN